MKRRIRLFLPSIAVAAVAAGTLFATSQTARAQVYTYTLDNTYNEATNSAPALVPNGGAFGTISGQTGYVFAPNQGISLSGAISDPNVYALSMEFQIDAISGYRSLINFKNLSTDNGLYNLDGTLVVYQSGVVASGPVGAFTPNQTVILDVTRNASNLFTASVNGVQQFTFQDVTNGTTAFTSTGNIIQFFQDDASEEAGGFLNTIVVNGTIAVVAPEPGTLALLGLPLLCGAAAIVRRRRR